MRTLWSGQQIQTTPTYRRSSNVSILQTIPSYLNTLQPLYPVRYNEKIWFSIDFIQPSKTKPCQRDSMHPFSSTAALWDALVNLFIFPPLMEKEMTVLYFVIALSKRRKKERKTRVRSEDDAFLDGRASTAANTPRLIRLGLEFSLHPSPRARIRLESCRRLIACQCLAIFGCRFSAGERMKRKTGGGIEEKYFSPSSRGKNRRRRRGRSKGTDFFSRSRSARCEFSTDFSLVRITYFRILNWVTIFVAIFLRQIPFISLFYKTSKLWITFETLY